MMLYADYQTHAEQKVLFPLPAGPVTRTPNLLMLEKVVWTFKQRYLIGTAVAAAVAQSQCRRRQVDGLAIYLARASTVKTLAVA